MPRNLGWGNYVTIEPVIGHRPSYSTHAFRNTRYTTRRDTKKFVDSAINKTLFIDVRTCLLLKQKEAESSDRARREFGNRGDLQAAAALRES